MPLPRLAMASFSLTLLASLAVLRIVFAPPQGYVPADSTVSEEHTVFSSPSFKIGNANIVLPVCSLDVLDVRFLTKVTSMPAFHAPHLCISDSSQL